jgi:hypothetical protein
MKRFPLFFVLLALMFSASKCNEREAPRAIIRVVDAGGTPVRDARVILFCPVESCVVQDTAFTNVAGETEHQIELPAVLQIDVYKLAITKTVVGVFPNQDTLVAGDTLCGKGFITLRTDEVAKETITIQRCD